MSPPRAIGVAAATPGEAVVAWARAERRYRAAGWAGRTSEIVARRYGSRPVLLTAPHAGHQLRNGWPKPADGGTGGLAETLARLSGCAVVTVTGSQPDDPNWDIEPGTFKREAEQRLSRHPFAIDIHAMRIDRHVDICIGTGPRPSLATLEFAKACAQSARRQGLVVSINQPFSAAHPGTMTAFVQGQGYQGMQIEFNARLLDPDGRPDAAEAAMAWLRSVVESVPESLTSPANNHGNPL